MKAMDCRRVACNVVIGKPISDVILFCKVPEVDVFVFIRTGYFLTDYVTLMNPYIAVLNDCFKDFIVSFPSALSVSRHPS